MPAGRITTAPTGDDAPHPLTTSRSPLLPSRFAPGERADVWEVLDDAATWIWARGGGGAPEPAPGTSPEILRQALRVLCVALRAAVQSGEPVALGALPWAVPVLELVRALRARLLEQALGAPAEGAVAGGAAGDPAGRPDPAAVLAVLGAMERLEAQARRDGARAFTDALQGGQALELLVEIAHDMRSPLGSILFLAERLQGELANALTPSQARQLGLIRGGAYGLAAMVGDVMELARGGDRLAAGEPTPLALARVVEELCAIVRPLAEEKGLELRVGRIPAGARLGHAAAVQRVLVNLVTNALKYTRAGWVALTVEPLDATRVAFTVSDSGPGIPPEVLAQLFQTFRRRAAGDDHAFSSAGLGMAICGKLLGAMGSELAVESAVGRGTRFHFVLSLPPLAPA